MFEIAIVTAFALTGLAVVTKVLGTTERLSTDTRTHTFAAKEHRKNLQALTNVLRNVDLRTVSGLESGQSTALSFKRVSGADGLDRTYEAVERIEWRPMQGEVWSVKFPGHLFLVGSGGERRIAKNVPAGGFQVRQEGSTLAVRLTTFYTTGQERTVQTTSETAISLRN